MKVDVAESHLYIAGKTGTGKSTFARRLIVEYFKPAGIAVIVLDPKKDPRFQADFITRDKAEFMREVRRRAGQKCVILIDESGTTIGAFAGEIDSVTTLNRELGHRAIIIGQRPAQTSKTAILNCGSLAVFQIAGRDAKVLADDFDCKEILEATRFAKGEFLFLPEHGPRIKGNIFAGLPKK